MAPVPLVTADAAGWFAVHALWADRLAGEFPRTTAAWQRLGGKALAARDLPRAVDLLVAAGADDDLRAVLRTEVRAQDLAASADSLGQLHARLPDEIRAAPEGELVAGIAVTATDLELATRLLTSAAERFAAADDDAGLLCAVEHLALRAHWREDVTLLTGLWAWAERLADLPEASGLLAIGEALAADTRGQAADVLTALDRIDPAALGPYWRTPVAWLRASAELALGYAESARRHVEVAVSATGPSLRGALSMLLVNAQTHSGDLAGAGDSLAQMLVELGVRGQRPATAPWARRWRRHGRRWPGASTTPITTWPGPTARGARPPRQPGGVAAGRRGDHRPGPGRRAGRRRPVLAADRWARGRRRTAALRAPAPPPAALRAGAGDARQFRAADVGPCYRPGLELAEALVALARKHDVAPAARLTAAAWTTAEAVLPRVDRRARHRRRRRRALRRPGPGRRHRSRRPPDAAPPRRRRRGAEVGAHVGPHAGRRPAAGAHRTPAPGGARAHRAAAGRPSRRPPALAARAGAGPAVAAARPGWRHPRGAGPGRCGPTSTRRERCATCG